MSCKKCGFSLARLDIYIVRGSAPLLDSSASAATTLPYPSSVPSSVPSSPPPQIPWTAESPILANGMMWTGKATAFPALPALACAAPTTLNHCTIRCCALFQESPLVLPRVAPSVLGPPTRSLAFTSSRTHTHTHTRCWQRRPPFLLLCFHRSQSFAPRRSAPLRSAHAPLVRRATPHLTLLLCPRRSLSFAPPCSASHTLRSFGGLRTTSLASPPPLALQMTSCWCACWSRAR